MTVEIGSRSISAAQVGLVATGAAGGATAASMFQVYRTHGGKFAEFAKLARTAVRPGAIGAGVGMAIGAGIAVGMPDKAGSIMQATLVGMGLGGLHNVVNGFGKMPAQARSFSRVRLVSGPVLFGAGIGAAFGMGIGVVSALAKSDKPEQTDGQ